MVSSRAALVLAGAALVGACSRTGTEKDEYVSTEPAPTPAEDVLVGTPASPILATYSRFSMARWTLKSGEQTTSPMMMLVLFPDGAVEIRDGNPQGLLIAKGSVDEARLAPLRALLARPEWRRLVGKRGASYPDGGMYMLEVQGRRMTRYRDPTDEPVAREAADAFEVIFKGLFP